MEPALRTWVGEALGDPVVDVADLGRRPNRGVGRVRLASGATAIVKHVTVDADPDGIDAAFLGTEAYALEALGRHATTKVAPALLASRSDPVCVVLEDLGDRPSLASLLLADDERAARATLLDFASTLGRVHADLAPHADDLERRRATFELPTRRLGFLGEVGRRWDVVRDELGAWGIATPGGIDEEVAAVAEVLDDRRWATLIHGDACPDNMTIDPVVLFDWETAYAGHALLDAAYLWMPFPTCWCAGALPPAVLAEAEGAYRAAAGAGLPPVLDDEAYGAALDAAVATWFLQSSVQGLLHAADDDPTWGISTHRHRLAHRARVVLQRGAGFEARYPGLTRLADCLVEAVQRRWPEAAAGLPVYPAFNAVLGGSPHAART